MKLSNKNIIIGASLSILLSIAVVPQLFAKDGPTGGTTTTTTTDTTKTTTDTTKTTEPPKPATKTTDPGKQTQKSSDTQTEKTDAPDPKRSGGPEDKVDNPNGETRKDAAREKLDDKKKAACEAHQTDVNQVITDVTARSKNHFDRITAIYDMTTKFYTEKGLTVSNYAALIAAVETAKTAASTANTSLATVPQFSCSSDGPKADIQAFRNKRLDKVDTFAAYREAVKALVAAVKAAAEAAAGTTSTTTTTGGTN